MDEYRSVGNIVRRLGAGGEQGNVWYLRGQLDVVDFEFRIGEQVCTDNDLIYESSRNDLPQRFDLSNSNINN